MSRQYFDGPRVVSAEESKWNRSQGPRNLEKENEELHRKVETMRAMCGDFDKMNQKCQILENDLKLSCTNLQHYKDRTKSLQKQVDGLKSGKLKPDNLPSFKPPNPNQHIIKALLNENQDLNKRIEQMDKIKDRVMKNTSNVDRSDLLEALVQLEEENRSLKAQIDSEGKSPHPFTGSDDEGVEITQLRERLQMSVNHSRDLTQLMEGLESEIEHTKKLLEEKTAQYLQLESYLPRRMGPPQQEQKRSAQVVPRGEDFRSEHVYYQPPPHPHMMLNSHPRGGVPPNYSSPIYPHAHPLPPHTALLPTMSPGPGDRHNRELRPRTSPHPPHSFQQSPDGYPYKN